MNFGTKRYYTKLCKRHDHKFFSPTYLAKMLLYDSAQITRHIAGHITTNDSGDVYEVEVVDNDDVRIIRHEACMAAGAKPVLNAAECVHLRAHQGNGTHYIALYRLHSTYSRIVITCLHSTL